MVTQDLSIDISVSKMLDWLIDRRHCNIKWQKMAKAAHVAMKKASKQSQDDADLSRVLNEYGLDWSEMDYLSVYVLNTFIIEKDGSVGWTKIGATERAKLWNSVSSLYKHENVHLAESASILTRLIQKEYPNIEKNIQKLKNKQNEANQRAIDLDKSSKAALARFTEECKILQIDQNQDPKPQLLNGLCELPGMIRSISSLCCSLSDACSYYSSYFSYSSLLSESNSDFENLKYLKLLVENPECTVYELETGKKPTHVVRSVVGDVGYDAGIAVDDDEDYAIEMVEVDDFEIEVEEEAEIELVEDDDNGVLVNPNIVASGEGALYLLESSSTRDLVMDDLAELESFLLAAGKIKSDSVPNQLKIKNESLSEWIKTINLIYSNLENEKISNFLLLTDDKNAADRITQNINKHKVMSNRRERESREALREKEDFENQEKELEIIKNYLQKRVHLLKEFLESAISEKYNNRPVKIQGCRI